jgi:hypothetical protein
MDFARILVQLDADKQASVFDAVVAIDSGVDHLLQYANIDAKDVRALVHGAMFTRGPNELKNTALFIGGSSVSHGEALLDEVRQSFFGPIRCSAMFDGNGANTTASAAVLSAARHVDLAGAKCLVLGGTGPVGQRVARLLLPQGADVTLASRDLGKAQNTCELLLKRAGAGGSTNLRPLSVADSGALAQALESSVALFSCGAAGVRLISAKQLESARHLRVAIDLNAVPPEGIEGVSAMDKGVERGKRFDYGAIGVGGLKMKIHREAVRTLFTRNDLVLDAEEIFAIGQGLLQAK